MEKGILDSSRTWMLPKLFNLGLPQPWHCGLSGPASVHSGAILCTGGRSAASLTPAPRISSTANQKCLRALPNVPWGQSHPLSLLRDTGL